MGTEHLQFQFTNSLIIFLKVISKVLFFSTTQRFTNSLVQLSIFLIDLLVGTHRLSSHARLEAFVIQTKTKLTKDVRFIMDSSRPSGMVIVN
jgi:hypothetical protein